MTAQEKAKELVDKFTVVGLQRRNEGVQCALICVDEILVALLATHDDYDTWEHWQEVKQEIERL